MSEEPTTVREVAQEANDAVISQLYRHYTAWVTVVVTSFAVLVALGTIAVMEQSGVALVGAVVAGILMTVGTLLGNRVANRWAKAWVWRYGYEPGPRRHKD